MTENQHFTPFDTVLFINENIENYGCTREIISKSIVITKPTPPSRLIGWEFNHCRHSPGAMWFARDSFMAQCFSLRYPK